MALTQRLAIAVLVAFGLGAAGAEPLVVGSKRFTESYILGEIVQQTLVAAGTPAEHKPGLGNTGVLEQALAKGAVDVYPEYTGTIVRELLKAEGNPPLAELNALLAPRGLKAAVPLGFNNTYALAMRDEQAKGLGIETLSDLKKLAPGALKLGLSHEFIARADGWTALKAAYGLPFAAPAGLDHGLAYEAIAAGQVDLIDIYSTDAKVGRYKLRVLRDDRAIFPRYDAVLLMRAGVDTRALETLAGRIDERTMIALNAQVELDGLSFAEAARRFVAGAKAGGAASATSRPQSFVQRLLAPDLARLAGQHIALVAASLALAVFLIALVGAIGFVPALLALFVYALLPIVRNTHAGLQGVPAGLGTAALALGLTRVQALRHVRLPLALPVLLAGVKTAAVINVGTATVAAFIGAGGFGERIVAGLALNDSAAMLAGAAPAALLALAVQFGFDLVEERLARRPGLGDAH